MRIVAAGEAHLSACFDVWVANEDFHHPEGVAEFPLHRHELLTGTLLLAAEPHGEGDAELVVGFGAVLERSGITYLADLFVWPDRHGRGIGGALMDALFAGRRGPRFTIASSHPAGRRLYRRFGMHPEWTLSTLVIPNPAVTAARLGTHLTARPVPVDEVLTLDRAVTHRERRADLDYEIDQVSGAGGEVLGLYDSGLRRPVGYGVLVTRRPWDPTLNRARLSPVVLAEPELAAPAYGALLAEAAARGAESVVTFLPTEHPGRVILEAVGAVETSRDLLMSSEPGLLDPGRYFPAPGTA